jgi:hypothetical protein
MAPCTVHYFRTETIGLWSNAVHYFRTETIGLWSNAVHYFRTETIGLWSNAVHYFRTETIGLWSNAVHYIERGAHLGQSQSFTHPILYFSVLFLFVSLQGESEGLSERRADSRLCFWWWIMGN